MHDPEELTSSNAVASNLENIMIFAGPALGAVLVGAFGVETAFWLNVATFGWSFLMLAGIRVPPRDAQPEDAGDEGGLLRETLAGVVVIAKDADLRITAVLAATQGVLFGALTVLNVIIAIEMLDAGPDGVGYLLAICGVGSVAGGHGGARAGRPQAGRHRHGGRRDRVGAAVPRCWRPTRRRRPRCSRCWSSGSWTRGSTSASTPCRSGWPRSG